MKLARSFKVLLSTLLVVSGGVVVAQAANSAAVPKHFSACLNLATKTLSNVSFAATAKCAGRSTAIEWNQSGPVGLRGVPGPRGANGAPGPRGATGAQGLPGPATIASLQGTPCSYNGFPSTIAIKTDSVTGVETITCTPVKFTVTVTDTSINPPIVAVNDTTNSSLSITCGTNASCSVQLLAGDSFYVAMSYPGSIQGLHQFNYSCNGGPVTPSTWLGVTYGDVGNCSVGAASSVLTGNYSVTITN